MHFNRKIAGIEMKQKRRNFMPEILSWKDQYYQVGQESTKLMDKACSYFRFYEDYGKFVETWRCEPQGGIMFHLANYDLLGLDVKDPKALLVTVKF